MNRRFTNTGVIRCILSFATVLSVIYPLLLNAQTPQFSQFYATPLYVNPAFAGNTLEGRIIGNYRHQWPSISKAFVTYSVSYDHNFSAINSGVGLLVMHDRAGTGGLRFTNIGGQYSYKVQLSRNLAMKAGVNLQYTQRNVNLSKLTFTDQLMRGGGVATSETWSGGRKNYFDVAAGLIAYTRQFWVGFASHHINRPNESLLGVDSRIPTKYSVHGGVNIPLKKTIKKKVTTSIIAAANYKAQAKYDQLDIGAYYNHFPMVFGLWYRGIPGFKAYEKGYGNNDAAILMVGYQLLDFRVGYSYDITISRLLSNTAGSHELSIIYEFASADKEKKKGKKDFIVPCAKF